MGDFEVDKSRLRPVDTSDFADRIKLFVDTFGGWDAPEYLRWIDWGRERYLNQISKERGFRVKVIRDQDGFTEFLRGNSH